MNAIARNLILCACLVPVAGGQEPQLLGVQRSGLFTPHPVLDIDVGTAQATALPFALTECDGLAFGPDGRLYANTYPDVVRVDRETGAPLGTVVSGVGPTADLALHPVTGELYVSYRSATYIDVYDRITGAPVQTLPALWNTLGIAWNESGSALYGATEAGELYWIEAGAITRVVDLVGAAGARPVALATHPITGVLYVSLQTPGADARLGIVAPLEGEVTIVGTMHGWIQVAGLTFAALPLGSTSCAGAANTTGRAASLHVAGSIAGSGELLLVALGLPPGEAGVFLASPSSGSLPGAGGSFGTLCLGTPFARVHSSEATSGPAGRLSAELDPTQVPIGAGTAIGAGETWYFQAWYRDGQRSNFTSALAVVF